MMQQVRKEVIDRLTKGLIDRGLLLEAGWKSYQLSVVPPDASQVQIDSMRESFFAGAQHLFGSIMSMLEPDKEPTANDLRRMDLIHKELERFLEEYKAQHFQS